MTSAVYLGIDVSKATLEVASEQQFICHVPNTTSGLRDLIVRLGQLTVQTIIIESTGCYSQLAADRLSEAGHAVALVQPGRVRHFAKSQGILAKTDRIDAQIIAQYGAKTDHLRMYQPPSKDLKKLRALVDRRDQLVEDHVREANRLEACQDQAMATHMRRSMASLRKRIQSLERQIEQVTKENEELDSKRKTMEKQKGVGPITVICLLTHLPELGTVNRQEIAALAGLAPYCNDSGPRQGQRSIYGGRARVRKALYMAARSAANHDDHLKAHYNNLVQRGKKTKVALIACARKLLVRLNALMAEQGEPLNA